MWMAGAHYISADGESNGVSEVINVTGYRYDATFFETLPLCHGNPAIDSAVPHPGNCARSQRRGLIPTVEAAGPVAVNIRGD